MYNTERKKPALYICDRFTVQWEGERINFNLCLMIPFVASTILFMFQPIMQWTGWESCLQSYTKSLIKQFKRIMHMFKTYQLTLSYFVWRNKLLNTNIHFVIDFLQAVSELIQYNGFLKYKKNLILWKVAGKKSNLKITLN